MQLNELTALSALDGRYGDKTDPLKPYFSEYGLIRYRVRVELEWLRAMAACADMPEVKPFSPASQGVLNRLIDSFGVEQAARVKALERTTNHDVKAVEYFLREAFSQTPELAALEPFIHFACTSEDINNLAQSLMVKEAREREMAPKCRELIAKLSTMAAHFADAPMLSRTHGQPATPTTLGKEIANFVHRLQRALKAVTECPLLGKFNGAVGNYNAHLIAYPDLEWPGISRRFVESLGLEWNSHTAQIEPHDGMAQLFDAQRRFNTICLDLCRDIWSYVSLGYFRQKPVEGEIGSSTMPHKINPIDFENAEGNLGLANALFSHMADKLQVSRMQRDLSDSTVLRNIGAAFGHTLIALESMLKGLSKLEIDRRRLEVDLEDNWDVLAEAVQTVMRRYGVADAYERLKTLTRGQRVDRKKLARFVAELPIPDEAKEQLRKLTPSTYLGLAQSLAKTLPET